MIDDGELLRRAQQLLEQKSNRTTGLDLRAVGVSHDADIVRIHVSHAKDAHLEDYVHILAAVEADLDVDDEITVLLVPVVDEAA